jgi:hypothetical protein
MDWQAIIALIIVAAAAASLTRRVVRTAIAHRRGEADGGGCGACPKNPDAIKSAPLVQLGDRTDPSSDNRR